MTEPHDRKFTHSYLVHYPGHEPREADPHYVDFQAYRERTVATAKCAFGVERGDFEECEPGPDSWPKGLELHHSHIEFAMANSVDLALLEHDYPGVSKVDEVGAWIESAENLMWLCTWHHRGDGGVHCATEADYRAEHYIRGLISMNSKHK